MDAEFWAVYLEPFLSAKLHFLSTEFLSLRADFQFFSTEFAFSERGISIFGAQNSAASDLRFDLDV